jgi:hypothetical protein
LAKLWRFQERRRTRANVRIGREIVCKQDVIWKEELSRKAAKLAKFSEKLARKFMSFLGVLCGFARRKRLFETVLRYLWTVAKNKKTSEVSKTSEV